MYTWILVFYCVLETIETFFSQIKRSKVTDYAALSKICVKRPLKSRQNKDLYDKGSLMKVDSIAECSPWSILQYFWPTLCDNWSWKPIFCLFERIPRSISYGVYNLQLFRFDIVCSNVVTWTTGKLWQYRLHSEIIVSYNLVWHFFCYRAFEGQYYLTLWLL